MFKRVDLLLVIPVVILLGIGLITIFSVNPQLFRNQAFFLLLSLFVFLLFTHVDASSLEALSKPFYLISLVGFIFLLFLGFESRGAARWLDIFGFRLQFSEIFKPFLALSLASFLSRKEKSFTTLGVLFLYLFPIIFLIYRQPDLGSALLYLFSAIVTLMLFGYPLWWFLGAAGAILLLLPLVFRFLHGYQRARLLTFLHLNNDPLGTSYNAIQAIIAVGSGMLVGKGLGQGTQSTLKFLPERHTDFIFATLSESLGFVGSILVILAFGFLLYRFYVIARNSRTLFEKLFISAAFALFFVQCFVNIGMNIGLLPIVGVPLPLVSYGGSSLLSTAIFLGIVSGIASSQKSKSTLEIR